uniref:Uncharacterized protein n=1 Tax=Anguilla anguilla TaxID=7936 RepID=A0A0E9WML2_ANGAN
MTLIVIVVIPGVILSLFRRKTASISIHLWHFSLSCPPNALAGVMLLICGDNNEQEQDGKSFSVALLSGENRTNGTLIQ